MNVEIHKFVLILHVCVQDKEADVSSSPGHVKHPQPQQRRSVFLYRYLHFISKILHTATAKCTLQPFPQMRSQYASHLVCPFVSYTGL